MKFESVPGIYRAFDFGTGDAVILAALAPMFAALMLGAGRELTLVAALTGLMTLMVSQ